MKNSTTILILSILLLTSCKAWDPALLDVQKDPINPKLLTLERRIQDLANTTVTTNDDELKLFTKEVEENLIDPYGDKYGYLVMKRNIIEMKMGLMPWILINGILLQTPLLFGVPYGKPSYVIEVEFRVMDSNNKLIGKYSAIGRGKNTIAAYHGYSAGAAYRKTYADALTDAFNKIRPEIRNDVERLNRSLKEAGKL